MGAKKPIKEAETKAVVPLFGCHTQAFGPEVLFLSSINQQQVFLSVFLAKFRRFFILANKY